MNKDIARKALETALELGASDCRISLAESTQTSISYLNGEIEKLQQSSSSAMGIAIFTEGPSAHPGQLPDHAGQRHLL